MSFLWNKGKKQLQIFIGVLNYERSYLQWLTRRDSLLIKLKKKNREFIWTTSSGNSYDRLTWLRCTHNLCNVYLPRHKDKQFSKKMHLKSVACAKSHPRRDFEWQRYTVIPEWDKT